jgi:iron complex outermembrane recepter protein
VCAKANHAPVRSNHALLIVKPRSLLEPGCSHATDRFLKWGGQKHDLDRSYAYQNNDSHRRGIQIMRLATVLTVALLGAVCLADSEHVQAVIISYPLNIPRQSLDMALKDLAQQTGLQIGRFSDRIDGGAMVGPVEGVRTPAQALEILLSHTGLEYKVVGGTTLAVYNPLAESIGESDIKMHPALRSERCSGLASGYPKSGSDRPQTGLPADAFGQAGIDPKSDCATAHSLESQLFASAQSAPETMPVDNTGGMFNVDNGTTAQTKLEEVVVTAQKRAENLQVVPISIMAVNADDMRRAGIDGTDSLGTLVAGFSSSVTSRYFQPHIRGIGTSLFGPALENPVALYIDDVYYGSQHSAPLDLSDMDQVAVLRGPQGTLFGRNTTGGVVQMTTRQPRQDFSGELNTELDDYLRSRTYGYVTGGIADNVKANLFVRYIKQGDGWGKNLVNGEEVDEIGHDVTARTTWVWTVADTTSSTLALDYNDRKDSLGPHIRLVPGVGNTEGLLPGLGTTISSSNPHDVTETLSSPNTSHEWGGSLKLEHDFGPVQLFSISAYRELAFDSRFSADGSSVKAFDVHNTLRSHQFTQEIRLHSHTDRGIQWVVGAYYYGAKDRMPESTLNFYNASGDSLNPTGCAGIVNQYGVPIDPSCADLTGYSGAASRSQFHWINQDLDTKSYAVFAQSTFPITDNTRLTAGLRHTHDQRSIDGSFFASVDNFTGILMPDPSFPPIVASQSFDHSELTWRAAIDQDLAPHVLGYASYNRGYKSGGYNGNGFPSDPPYEKEIVDAFEVGLKTELLDGRLRANPAVFYNDYKSPQVSVVDNFTVLAANAGGAKVYGVDLDTEWQATNALRFTLGFEWLHANYTEFDSIPFAVPVPGGGELDVPTATSNGYLPRDGRGNRLSIAPEYTYNVGLNYERHFLGQRFDFYVVDGFSSSYFFEPDNVAKQDAYHMVNTSLTWTSANEHVSAGVSIRNMLNELIAAGQFQAAPTLGYVANYGIAPRTYALTLAYRF